jgi:hypothetical protein
MKRSVLKQYGKTGLQYIGILFLLLQGCKPEPFVFNTHIEGKFIVKHQSEPFAGEWVVLLLGDKEIQRTKTRSDGSFKFSPVGVVDDQKLKMYLLNKDYVSNKTEAVNSIPFSLETYSPYFTANTIGYNTIYYSTYFVDSYEGSLLEEGYTFLPVPLAGAKNEMEIELTRTTEVKLHFRYPPGITPPFLSYFGFDYINTVPYPTITSFGTFQVPLEGRTFTIKHLPEKSEVFIPYFYRSISNFETVYDTVKFLSGTKENSIEKDILIQ